MVVARDGRWTSALASTAPAVGLMDVIEFPAAEFRIAPGDTVIVMSDGVGEARNARGEDFDLAALATLAHEASGADLGALADEMVNQVCRHCGGDPSHDDVTLLLLRRSA